MLVDKIQHSTRLQLETDHFPGKSFRLKKNHPLGKIKVQTLYKIETEKKPTKRKHRRRETRGTRLPPSIF